MLFSALVYFQLVTVTAVYTLLAALPCILWMISAFLFRSSGREEIIRFFILWYGKAAVKLALFPWVKVRYEDLSGIPDSGGIYIFNHRSASDPFLVSCITNLPPVQIVNKWPMHLFFYGFFARHGGYINIRETPFERLTEQVAEFVRQGVPVMAFPEGTRSGSRNINPFHGAMFRIAKLRQCPLIPVAVAGNEKIPSRDFRISRGTILIRKLKPVPREIIDSMTPYQLKCHVKEILKDETAKMDAILDHGL